MHKDVVDFMVHLQEVSVLDISILWVRRRDGHPASTNRTSRVQRPEDFMDEEDDQLMGRRMVTQEGYSRVQTKVNAQNLILQKHDQIGKRLLMQLGWRVRKTRTITSSLTALK